MKKRDFLLIGILLTMILLSTINIFVRVFTNYTLFIFILLLIGLTNWIYGIQEHKSVIEKDVILSIIVYLIFYYLVIYIIGYFIGFTKSIYGFNIKTILTNVFPLLITIPALELLRYIINSRTNNKIGLIILSYIAFTLISITILLANVFKGTPNLTNIIEQFGIYIIPLCSTNILATYLSIKVGYKSNIVFRYLMELPTFILPIFPKFGNYIESVFKISLPIFFLLWLYSRLKQNEIKKVVLIEKKKIMTISRLLLLLFSLIVVYFICGLFRFHALVIASGSMQPSINVGDIVIVDKLDNTKKEYKEGEVITYQKDNSLICHRIIKVTKSGETTLYETKGDNNDSPDQLLVEQDKVLGSVKYKIKYIGLPTVILNKYR